MNTDVKISLGIALKGLSGINVCESSFKRLRKAVKDAGESVKHLNKNLARIKYNTKVIKNIDEQLDNFKSKIIERAAVAASMAIPVKFAIDFESAMIDVKKYIEFDSEEQFRQLGNDIKKLSADLGKEFTEIAEIAASGGQQGLKADEIINYTKLVAKLGVAFDMSGRDAGDAAAYVMNNFKLTTKELEKLGNQMNFLDDKMSMVKSKELFNVLNRTSSNANILGLSADSTAALGASLLSVGKAPEVASTALNSMFNALANLDGQDAKFHKALEKMGMDAEYLKTALKIDPSKTVQEFILAISRIDANQQMGVLTDMFGKQFSDEIGSLVVNKDILNNAFSLIKENSDGSLDEALNLKLKTTASSIDRLVASLKNVAVNLGSVLLPPLALFADWLSALSNFMTSLTNKSKILSAAISGFGVVVVSFAVLFPALGYAVMFAYAGWLRFTKVLSIFRIVMTLSTTVTKIKTAAIWAYNIALRVLTFTKKLLIITTKVLVVTLNSAIWVFRALTFAVSLTSKALRFAAIAIRVVSLALLTNPIGFILMGIALVAGLIIANWGRVREWFVQFVGWFSEIWQSVSTNIKEFFAPIVDWFVEKFSWIGIVIEKIVGIGKSVAGWFSSSFNLDFSSDSTPDANFSSETGTSTFIQNSFSQPQAAAMPAGGSPVNVNFSGNFNLMSNDGKFDLESFKNQITTAVQDALRRNEFNRRNRDIRG